MNDIISNTIRSSSLFMHLSDDQLTRLVKGATFLTFAEGEQVIEEGKMVDHLFVLLSGEVHVWTNAMGKHVDLKTLGAGAYFGEVSLLSGKTATATVEARSAAEVVGIAREAILAIISEDKKVRKVLEGVTLARAKDTLGKVLQ